ncbi:MAG TPA: ATP-dependent DNA ligase [Terriglobales bacterium]|nr:ATP-dependent DNA ligase [Terriglobales bacterium]
MPAVRKRKPSIDSGSILAEALGRSFPRIDLPIHPPYPSAEAKAVKEIPRDSGWLYEPKWDGFRCLAFRSGDKIILQSKAGQPLARYFPEVVKTLRTIPARKFVLDGELVIRGEAGLDFDALLQRIHPAESRIRKLSQQTPATYLVFDLLVDARGKRLTSEPLSARRMALQEFAAANIRADQSSSLTPRSGIQLSPATSDVTKAKQWMQHGSARGLDGVVAKRLDCEYTSGERIGMVKVKRIRTADCVVGGFRWAQKGGEVGSLLLGLYNDSGELDHIGFSSSFSKEERRKLKSILTPLIAKGSSGSVAHQAGFTGKAPGGPSRWTREDRNTEWFPLKHKLVGEFQYDHFSGGRFRHGTKFLRWRPDKDPHQCGMEQVAPAATGSALKELSF